ncbi:unnamed protein product [Moneuplotes crassus]|uniref:Uncharacterized protein n=1 Tax=Euplotes crassus TaxID=5936 RepID=A0AAD1USZ1_EUPCR|nr:unnamed protein product [Moneuplotes crassus]
MESSKELIAKQAQESLLDEAQTRDTELNLNKKMARAINSKEARKVYYKHYNQRIWYMLKTGCYYEAYLYPNKSWALGVLSDAENGKNSISHYELTEIPFDHSTNLLSSNADFCSFNKPIEKGYIGNLSFWLNLNIRFYRDLTFKILSMTTLHFKIKKFSLNLRDIAKILISGRTLETICFFVCKFNLEVVTKPFLNDKDHFKLKTNLRKVEFDGFYIQNCSEDLSCSLFASTIMKNIASSFLPITLKEVTFTDSGFLFQRIKLQNQPPYEITGIYESDGEVTIKFLLSD